MLGPPVAAVEQSVTYNAVAAASSAAAAVSTNPATLSKRTLGFNDDCGPQPDGYGPKVVPDTPEVFLASQDLQVSPSMNINHISFRVIAELSRRTLPSQQAPLQATSSLL